jgi:alpha-1,2-mannosyltransferase
VILAVVLWGLAIAMLAVPGPRDPFGTLKGADFVHFYTLGRVALDRDTAVLYDGPALNARQVALVPASAGDDFIPVYSPQTALAFAPLALAPYGVALALWMALTLAGYYWAVRVFWQLSGRQVDGTLLFWACAAFPPIWNLVLHGQTTFFPLVAFAAATLSLSRQRRFLAGASLGLLAIKPQFALMIALIALVAREWRMIAGAVVSLALQASAVVLVFGSGVLNDYLAALRSLPAQLALLEPKPYQLHSLRVLTDLVAVPFNHVLWGAGVIAVLALTYRAWTTGAPVVQRMAVLVIASVIVSPHLTVYDGAVLAPAMAAGMPLMALATGTVAPLAYGLVVSYLFPTALVIRIQMSVLLLGVVFWKLTRTLASGATAEHDPLAVAMADEPPRVGFQTGDDR